MKYLKKEEWVDAEQWFEVTYDREAGTHIQPVYHLDVGYYRTPDRDGQDRCKHCEHIMHDHGWIDTYDGGQVVCPGDWIVVSTGGYVSVHKDEPFRMFFEGHEEIEPKEKEEE